MSYLKRNPGTTPIRRRKTIRWVVPKISLLSSDLEENLNGTRDFGDKYIIPMYINPNQLSLSYSKIVNETLTKGGYVVQYWGEKNVTAQIGGTTGSSGIEGIAVLEKIYRNEQFEFEKILKNRAKIAKEKIRQEAVSKAADLNNISSSERQSLSVNIFNIGDGLETIADVFCGNKASIDRKVPASINTHESLGALATQVEMHHDGIIHQGYFTAFSITESAGEPGIFTYSLSFTILRSEGTRDNFMAWHRSPFSGDTTTPRQSTTSKDDYTEWNLTFPPVDNRIYPPSSDLNISQIGPTSTFIPDQTEPVSSFNPTKRR